MSTLGTITIPIIASWSTFIDYGISIGIELITASAIHGLKLPQTVSDWFDGDFAVDFVQKIHF